MKNDQAKQSDHQAHHKKNDPDIVQCHRGSLKGENNEFNRQIRDLIRGK